MEKEELRKHFNEVASGKEFESYEERRWSADPKRKVQEEATREFIVRYAMPLARTVSTITELGAGPGTWTKLLHEASPTARFLLLDIAGEMLTRAKSVLPSGVVVDTKEGDFGTIALPPSATEFFFSSRAIEYVSPKDGAVRTIFNHLTSGGKGVLITKMPKPLMNQLSGRALSAIHKGQIAPEELARLLTAAGFIDVRLYPVTFSFPLLRSPHADRFLSSLFGKSRLNPISAPFAESYGATFRKP